MVSTTFLHLRLCSLSSILFSWPYLINKVVLNSVLQRDCLRRPLDFFPHQFQGIKGI